MSFLQPSQAEIEQVVRDAYATHDDPLISGDESSLILPSEYKKMASQVRGKIEPWLFLAVPGGPGMLGRKRPSTAPSWNTA